MNERSIIHSSEAPKALGPYSQAVRYQELIFTAGQLGLDPVTGELVAGGIEEQTRQVLQNLQAVLKAGGSSLAQVLKTTVFLTDLQHFPLMNQVYAGFFTDSFPARSTIQVSALPKGGLVEIEAVAYR
jgi:2-iminobutanoate/2-iminopropanoate deaminase